MTSFVQRVGGWCGSARQLICGRCVSKRADDYVTTQQNALETCDPEASGFEHSGASVFRVRALYDFAPLQSGDLSFRRGDILGITSRDGDDWWKAVHLTTGMSGVIPSTYVTADDDDNHTSQIWWFDMNRQEIETLLMLPGNPRGTFLLRPSRDGKSSVLSLRNFDESTSDLDIKHYRIKTRNDQVYIIRRCPFQTLKQLVAHYQQSADGLCHRLVCACPRRPEFVPFKHLEVPRSEIRLDKKLGKGKFGEVFKGIWKNKLEVAVKTLTTGSMTPDNFLQEAKILHKLRHRRLVLLMGVVTVDEPMFIIMELVPLGALNDHLKSERGRLLKFTHLMDFAAQIAEGMAFVEARKHIHRDLRAANVLLGDNNNVKIADLGLARLLDEDFYNPHSNVEFPVKWTAPEAILDKRFSIKSDVWSFGILLYEIVTYGRNPYPGKTNAETIDALQESNYRMPNPDKPAQNISCPGKLYDKMLECWSEEPGDRPTFQELETWFDSYCTELEVPYSLDDEADLEETQD